MSHKICVKKVPHRNKDGTLSKTKFEYRVLDRTRGKVVLVGVETSQKAADDLVNSHREQIVADHQKKHPDDLLFQKKHGIGL